MNIPGEPTALKRRFVSDMWLPPVNSSIHYSTFLPPRSFPRQFVSKMAFTNGPVSNFFETLVVDFLFKRPLSFIAEGVGVDLPEAFPAISFHSRNVTGFNFGQFNGARKKVRTKKT